MTARQRKLVEDNVKLTHHFAKRLRSKTVSYEDLASAGMLGLMAAARGFKPQKGYKFSTYAAPFIKQHLQRALGHEPTVRAPERAVLKKHKLPVTHAWESFLHEPASDTGGIDAANLRLSVRNLRRKVDTLPKHHGAVLRATYFANGHARETPWTTRQVGKHLGLSASRVSQLLRAAKAGLRKRAA